MREIDEFYLSKEEPIKSCLMALRDFILEFNADITEALKYKMPCFLYKGKMWSFLWVDKKLRQPYILMVDGGRLIHPQLEQGNRARMKVIYIDPNSDLPVEDLTEILDEAISIRS